MGVDTDTGESPPIGGVVAGVPSPYIRDVFTPIDDTNTRVNPGPCWKLGLQRVVDTIIDGSFVLIHYLLNCVG